eukprot:m.228435 g.228435  ORF g.228435 m.228435 type:complete len:404 (-) comp15979_c0_seq1:48-1259(-)
MEIANMYYRLFLVYTSLIISFFATTNATSSLQNTLQYEQRKAQNFLHRRRQMCANESGDLECGYIRHRLTENNCSRHDAQKILNAFRLRKSFWRYCLKYNRRNSSVANWADKATAKQLAQQVVPELRVVKTLAVVYNATEIMGPGFRAKLPHSFVMKGTHGSMMTVVVNGSQYHCINLWTAKQYGHCLDTEFKSLEEALYRHCERWLIIDFGALTKQHFYSPITPGCIFEESLVDSEGNYPKDIKFFTGGGQILAGRYYIKSANHKFIQATDSLPDFSGVYLTNRSMCTADLSKYSAHEEWKGSKFQVAAEKLAKLFPYARIDFFDTDPPTFQEITFTPNNCQPNDQHHLFTAWVWGYIIFMRAHISPHCLAWINRLSLCDELIFRWLRSQVRPIDAKKGPIQ